MIYPQMEVNFIILGKTALVKADAAYDADAFY
jgi:hypothetical protein